MKSLTCILLFSCLGLKLLAQDSVEKKPSTLVFHVFYNDFNTAQKIRTTSLSNVLNKNQWTNIADMQMGFGFSYLKGLNKNIDFVSSLDGSATDYLFKDGTQYGSNKFLLDVNAGVNIKPLTHRHPVVPYLSAGAGFSLYQGKAGVYIPVGLGLQFNVFNQAFVFTNAQYRRAISADVNDHFQYSVGIGASIGKKKHTPPPIAPPVAVVKLTKPDTIPVIVKILTKSIIVTVTDEQAGFPLAGVEVTISASDVSMKAVSDTSGRVNFNAVKAADYTITGSLNDISTTTQAIIKNGFDINADAININITHNDPRFTLRGVVSNKTTHTPEGGVMVNVANTTKNTSLDDESNPADGTFALQLEAGSDFTISGKKAGYISNIEKTSTKGLNRSTTLYVKLELGIEQALPNKTITLSNIYYDTGSIKIKPAALSDLEKLVKFLNDNPAIRVEIASHTDSRGSAVRNLKLSQARAQEVVNYLQKQGIGKSRLTPKGYGETKPVNGCVAGVKCTEAQNAQNRRTEFKVIAN